MLGLVVFGPYLVSWLSRNDIAYINEVVLRRARLVPGWVTARGCTNTLLAFNQPPKPTQPGHPPSVMAMVTGSKRRVLGKVRLY